jgi:hypothetical protein
LHGTSVVISNILTKRKLSWIERFVNKFIPVKDTNYDLVYSSRNVIKNQYDYGKNPNHFYKEDIWGAVAKEVYPLLDPGITIYGEIVGYLQNGSYIQKGYDYGCKQGEHNLYVYRITYTDAIGNVLEFTTNQMVNYCNRKGLRTVPLHYYGPVSMYAPDHTSLLNNLQSLVRERCYICNNKVPAEGIVVTVESNTFQGYKLKSDAFYEFESKMLDENYEDIESEN